MSLKNLIVFSHIPAYPQIHQFTLTLSYSEERTVVLIILPDNYTEQKSKSTELPLPFCGLITGIELQLYYFYILYPQKGERGQHHMVFSQGKEVFQANAPLQVIAHYLILYA